jgi:hypothetical protein
MTRDGVCRVGGRHGDVTGRKRILVPALALSIAVAAFAGVAGANHSVFEYLSAGEIHGNGFFFPNFKGASADGTRVFFHTDEKLVRADTDNSYQDVYERSGGSTKLVSAGEINGDEPVDASFQGASADGTRVFFQTTEQLVPSDSDRAQDVYQRSGGTTTLVSAGLINGNGAFPASFGGASADGTRVFFVTSEQLVPSDTDASQDVYQRESGTTRRVSAGQENGNGAFDASFSGASADGARVFFTTAEQLVSSDSDNASDIYERFARVTTLVSAGQINTTDRPGVRFQGASADGTRVFFETLEQLVSSDTDSAEDVYERSDGTTTLVSAGEINGNGLFRHAYFLDASTGGRRVFFTTKEALVPADTDEAYDVYERTRGTTTLHSGGQINGNGDFHVFSGNASADGTRVFFATAEPLVAADTDARRDVYEHFAGTTSLVSTGEVNGNGDIEAFQRGASADGTRVFFETAEKLVSSDTERFRDVYERAGGATTRVSPGNGAFDAVFSGATADGSAVFFHTDETLLPGDTDSILDLYGAYTAP